MKDEKEYSQTTQIKKTVCVFCDVYRECINEPEKRKGNRLRIERT